MEHLPMVEIVQLTLLGGGVILGFILAGYIMGRKTIILHEGSPFVKEEPTATNQEAPTVGPPHNLTEDPELNNIMRNLSNEIESPFVNKPK